jgi:DNA-damage-inducible protein J
MPQVNIRMDSKLKEETEQVLDEIGLNFSSAVNIFARQVVLQNGIPFPLNARPKNNLEDTCRERRLKALNSLLQFAHTSPDQDEQAILDSLAGIAEDSDATLEQARAERLARQ